MEDQKFNSGPAKSGLENLLSNNKKNYLLIGAVVILVAAVAFVLYVLVTQVASRKAGETNLPSPSGELGEEAAEENTYGTLPENTSLTNPLEKAPEINPADKANPLKDTYNNPFE